MWVFFVFMVLQCCDCVLLLSHRETPTTRKELNMKTLNLGNNEQISTGVVKNNDGTFTAMTFSQSKTFKTQKGAEKWLSK